MPTEDEQDDLDDGSAGGQIRWSPDTAITPPAGAAQPGAPVSWESLFSGSQPAQSAPVAQSNANSGPGSGAGSNSNSSAGEPGGGDKLFARGPGQMPAPKREEEYNPFTTPDSEPEPAAAPVSPPSPGAPGPTAAPSPFARPAAAEAPASSAPDRSKTQEQQSQSPSTSPYAAPPAPFLAAPVPAQSPAPTNTPAPTSPFQPPTQPTAFQAPPRPFQSGPVEPAKNPASSPAPANQNAPVNQNAQSGQTKETASQAQAPAVQNHGTPQALGFNPAPQLSSASDPDKNPAASKDGGKSAPPVVKQYFTADDIEEEIAREQGLSSSSNAQTAARPQPAAPAAPPQPAPSPFAPGGQPNQGTGAPAQPPYGQSNVPPFAQMAPKGAPYGQSQNITQTTHLNAGEGEAEDGPDLSAVPELETARIWEQRSTKEILMSLLKAKKAEYAVALFASTDGAVQGEMLIVKSTIIHGAKLVDPDLAGYEAIKRMMAIPHGTYTLLDVTQYVESAQQLEQGMNVRIMTLANALPNLPYTVEELMGAGNISRIRSQGPADLEAAEKKPKPPKSQYSLRERLPSTKMMALIGLTILALIMMVVVLYTRR